MSWYAWYSPKQADLLGWAEYINVTGEVVLVTEVNQDPHYRHMYNDSTALGRVTHFCHVVCRHGTKRQKREQGHKMAPPNLHYVMGKFGDPSLIIK